jgi:glutamyl-Q tRNA(Asp) synthetase
VAALASWLDARAQLGQWLVRIEDIDPPREEDGAAQAQLSALAALGLVPDEPVTFQSANGGRYAAALASLQGAGHLYRCDCSRSAIEQAGAALGLAAGVYPGTCRNRAVSGGTFSLRVRVPDAVLGFVDRACGPFSQRLQADVGDFVVRRSDGLWAYQLAVVVDDAADAITDVVRGADLLDNTPRQMLLQRLLGLPTPRYLHVAVARNAAGEKLSKQTGAAALDLAAPVQQLELAWRHLGFAPSGASTIADFLLHAVQAWRQRWCAGPAGTHTIGAAAVP